MAKVEIYTKANCPYCDHAKQLLGAKQVEYIEHRVDESHEAMQAMLARSDMRTVPQIYIDDTLVGGFDDLAALEQSGKLDDLLRRQS